MGADQIAVIRPALVELADALSRGEPGAASLCASFSVSGHPDVWAQVQADTINVAYPQQEEPLTFVQGAGLTPLPGLAVESWQAGRYATFRYGPSSLRAIAGFLDRLLIALHGLPADDYELDVTLEHV